MRFLTAPVCVLFASALAGAKAQLKNMLKTIRFYDIICVCAVCARSANILQTERKSSKKLSKCKRRTPSTEVRKKAKQALFWEPNCFHKLTRRPPGAPWPPPARDFRAKSSPKELLEASRGGKNNLGTSTAAPERIFQRVCQKKSHRGGVGRRCWRGP